MSHNFMVVKLLIYLKAVHLKTEIPAVCNGDISEGYLEEINVYETVTTFSEIKVGIQCFVPIPAAACLLGLWVRIPPRACMSVSCECCVLSGRGLCDELVPRPEESYRVWCV
jgi:hypothetical protein